MSLKSGVFPLSLFFLAEGLQHNIGRLKISSCISLISAPSVGFCAARTRRIGLLHCAPPFLKKFSPSSADP